jgi:ADP-heptose:LPS heptosyltransferase
MQLFDGFITYDVGKGTAGSRFAKLAPLLRNKRFDTIVYLAPSQRRRQQIVRDWSFFRLVGMKQLLGFRNFRTLPRKQPGIPLPTLPSEGDLLLERLAADGIEVPAPDQRSVDLNLTVQDEKRFTDWVSRLHSDGGRRWIGVGPGCKQPVNGWPIENYAGTLSELIKRFDIWPVIFGGSEDRDAGAYLINQAGRGYNAAGKLDVRAAAAAMRHCALFVGNDTGTMHIAASAGIPCIGIYSSRQWRGYGSPTQGSGSANRDRMRGLST